MNALVGSAFPLLHEKHSSKLGILCLPSFKSHFTALLHDPTNPSFCGKTVLFFLILLVVPCTVMPATKICAVNRAFLFHYLCYSFAGVFCNYFFFFPFSMFLDWRALGHSAKEVQIFVRSVYAKYLLLWMCHCNCYTQNIWPVHSSYIDLCGCGKMW